MRLLTHGFDDVLRGCFSAVHTARLFRNSRGSPCVCRVIEQCSQLTSQPGAVVRAVEWQHTAYAQAYGTDRVVGLVESSGGQKLWATRTKSKGQSADPA